MWSKELFFFNDTATTDVYTLSLHDALPILAWLFLETYGDAVVELHNAIALGVVYRVGEYGGARFALRCTPQERREIGTVENIVAEDQSAMIGADELSADHECLREAAGIGLHRIADFHTPASAFAEQFFEIGRASCRERV